MKKRVMILGSTGSIGCRTLDVIRDFPDLFEVSGLSSLSKFGVLKEQVREFHPKAIAFGDMGKWEVVKNFANQVGIQIFKGKDGLVKMVEEVETDIVVVATVGSAGLFATLKAIALNHIIALANKEVLVTAGHLVMKLAREKNVPILPIDSEHNAIFQCLIGQDKNAIRRIILTASGGPFRKFSPEDLKNVSLKDTLDHPTWKMGPKITVDSATMMNKGFEVIEGKYLFDISIDAIDVVIHPQSIIHSMVEFIDGSILAQLSRTDMYLPIQNVLTYPERKKTTLEPLDLTTISALSFEKPDLNIFPCLGFAYEAGRLGGTYPTALNASNEIAVERFLKEEISFIDIPRIIEFVMKSHSNSSDPDLETIQETDKIAREMARNYV